MRKCKVCPYFNKSGRCMLKECVYDDEFLENERRESKCYKCVWGKWVGYKYFCMLPRCMPMLEEAFRRR